MSGDGLDEPLGTNNKARPPRSRSLRRGALVVASGLALSGLGFLALHQDKSPGGEPFAVATIDRTPTSAVVIEPRPMAASAHDPQAFAPVPARASEPLETSVGQPPGQDVRYENGVKVIRSMGSGGSRSLVLKVPDARDGLAVAPDPRVAEPSRFGLLPRVGPDGARPADVYGRHVDLLGERPRVAILIGGMGPDDGETARAAASLPGAVTFGFAPYGSNLEEQVKQAREAGHEVVLQLPMEGAGRDEAALPHALLASRQGNEDRLHWLLGRFAGYAGVVNDRGGRLLGDAAALRPLMQELAARGLYFVDDGSAARSLSLQLAAEADLPSMRADLVLDAKPDADSITAALNQLEAVARSRGFALGLATSAPTTDAIIGRYGAELERRGLDLVSVGEALAAGPRLSVRNGPERSVLQP